MKAEFRRALARIDATMLDKALEPAAASDWNQPAVVRVYSVVHHWWYGLLLLNIVI